MCFTARGDIASINEAIREVPTSRTTRERREQRLVRTRRAGGREPFLDVAYGAKRLVRRELVDDDVPALSLLVDFTDFDEDLEITPLVQIVALDRGVAPAQRRDR